MKKIVTITILAFLLTPCLVKADGFSIYADRSFVALHGENTQIAAINYEDNKEKLLLAVKFEQLVNDSIVWIVPIPANASDVKINIMEEFPMFHGSDILLRVDENREDVTNGIAMFASLSQIYTFPFTIFFYYGVFGMAGKGVEVYAHVEKEGIVTEVVTAENANALYDYLREKNITLDVGSIPIIDDYIGENYTFVVSWVTTIERETYRTPAIFIEFPTDKIYYPLKPTSIYGERGIPILIYVIDFVKPEIYPEIEEYSQYKYFEGSMWAGSWLKEFYAKAEQEYERMSASLYYTRIMIGAEEDWIVGRGETLETPSAENFVDDLWMEKLEKPPPTVERALVTLNNIEFLSENLLFVIIIWLILVSLLTGGLVGFLLFRNVKKFSLIGLANCFTIIGLLLATLAFVKEKRALFIVSFTIVFLIVNFLVISPIVKYLIL